MVRPLVRHHPRSGRKALYFGGTLLTLILQTMLTNKNLKGSTGKIEEMDLAKALGLNEWILNLTTSLSG